MDIRTMREMAFAVAKLQKERDEARDAVNAANAALDEINERLGEAKRQLLSIPLALLHDAGCVTGYAEKI